MAPGLPGPTAAQQVWSIEQVLTLGSYGDAITFGQITGIAVRPSGEILVLDRMEGAVLVFDADGSPRGRIGKPGQGPGELSNLVIGPYLTPGGALVIADLGNSRVSFFEADASYSHSFHLDALAGMTLRWATQGSDRILKEVQPRPNVPGMPEGGPREVGILAIARDGTELGMVTTFDLPPVLEVDPGGRMSARIFAEMPVWATTLEGHLITGRSGAYRLEVRDTEGNVVGEITRDVSRRPVTAEDRDHVIRQLEEQRARMELPSAAREMMGDPIFSDSLPVIVGTMSGPNGTILVTRGAGLVDAFSLDRQDPSTRDVRSSYDVHSLADGYQGVLELPPRVGLGAANGNYVYGVAKDEFEVETVVVYRVRRPGG